jgi:hypothetical protein
LNSRNDQEVDMRNDPTPSAGNVNATAAARWPMVGLLLALVTPLTGAQTITGTTLTTVMRSGLHSFSPRHSALVTVAETGAIGSSARVTIEFRDDADTLVAAFTGDLRRGKPVRLQTPTNTSGHLVQVRTIVKIVTLVDGGSNPVTVLEDLGPDSLVARIIVCGPPGKSGGGQEYCPDWVLTTKPS